MNQQMLEWLWVFKLIIGVLLGSLGGTFLSIHVAKRIIQGNLVNWISEMTGGETESSGLVKKFMNWAEGDFARAVGKAMAEELEKGEENDRNK